MTSSRPGAPSSPATIGRRGGALVAAAAAASALSGFVAFAVAAKVLTVAENTVFVTFWSTVFVCFGVLSGLSMEVTRSVTAAADPAGVGDARTPARPARVLAVGGGVGAVLALVGAATAVWWGPALQPGSDAVRLALLVCAAVALYAGHSVVVGALAARRSWGPYTAVIGADATVRLVLVAGVLLASAHVVGAAVAVVAATVTWLVVVVLSPEVRAAAWSRGDAGASVLVRRVAAASLAQGASALLVVGFPVLLALTTPTDVFLSASPLLVAISYTRAPLLVPLNAYQGVAVTHFVAHRADGWRALVPVLRVLLVLGAVAVLGAWLLGPWLFGLLGPDYRLDGGVLAGLTAASVGIAVLTLTGALCQALTAHRAFVTGWLVAVAATVGLLLLLSPLPLEARCTVALAVGPLLGVVVHLRRVLRTEVTA